MKHLFRLSLIWVSLLSSAHAFDDTGFQAKLGVGSSFSPQTFMVAGTVEYRADSFFALGPSLLWGSGDFTDYFVPTMGARFILPKEFLFGEDKPTPGLDLFLQVGAGFAFRETTGFRKRDVTYQAGLGGDFFLTPMLSLGVQGNVNLVGEDVEQSFFSLLGTAGVRF